MSSGLSLNDLSLQLDKLLDSGLPFQEVLDPNIDDGHEMGGSSSPALINIGGNEIVGGQPVNRCQNS